MDPITITLTLLALKTVLGGKTAVSATPEVANAQQQLADATALNTRIQQEVVVLKQQAEQAKREMDSANDARTKAEAVNRAVEAQKQRDEGLRVQAASAQDVADLKQQLAVAVGVAQTARDERDRAQAVQRSGEQRRDEKEAAFQREIIAKAAYEQRISELQAAAAASKTAPVTITKSVTSRDLNRN